MKPNSAITRAYINPSDELIIKTDNESQLESLESSPPNAFEHGIEQIIIQAKFNLPLHNVDPSFDETSYKAKKALKENYNIDGLLRMMKKTTNQRLHVVKAVTSDQEMFKKITDEGFIKLGFSRIRVLLWKFSTFQSNASNVKKSDTDNINVNKKNLPV